MDNLEVTNILQRFDDNKRNWKVGKVEYFSINSCKYGVVEIKTIKDTVYVDGRLLILAIKNALRTKP